MCKGKFFHTWGIWHPTHAGYNNMMTKICTECGLIKSKGVRFLNGGKMEKIHEKHFTKSGEKVVKNG